LTGWSYENDQAVWIVDPKGLRRHKEYENQWSATARRIPRGTIYEYNKRAKICTEICHPLRSYGHNGSRRAAGVLNIELSEPIYPSAIARRFISKFSKVIEQLQNRRLASQTSEGYAREAIQQLTELKATLADDEPGFRPKAFVAMPMSTPSAKKMGQWVEEGLRSRGIHCAWPTGNGDITEAIWKNIRTAHLGVVISTGFNPNVMYEWGYLLACKKPIIRLHSKESADEKDPFDVASGRRRVLNALGEEVTKESVLRNLNTAIDELHHDNSELAELLNAYGPRKEVS
jgi:hypothetical protein